MDSHPSPSRRIFVAIPVPHEIFLYLEKLKKQNENISAIKWTRPHNLHLTIYFIGNIEAKDFEEVVATVKAAVESQKKFIIEFEKICLATKKKPKMIWARFSKHESFSRLANSINEALKFIILQNKFHFNEPVPHITFRR